jgi:hypothetical protein
MIDDYSSNISDIENYFHLTENEKFKLKQYLMSKKDTIFIDTLRSNCSICFENFTSNYRKKLIKLPICCHIFHWKLNNLFI